ncbi:heme exporter protein CcmD [Aestuariirhabdus litorea]|uniref:Heme exporter protein D n=1 Tax=Aestuariirhabdus litorea TaxID=2528527 RepID=A0A3P3VUH5_9GAMM|nr:heme exporter protein CcmD [Aestuariirhabdus litorea]RRJ84413.1 heme exporter protein CcmD [Aestuariirhabdus litorea]RWW97637.1 heme exporter protein CcmD [Endozoicomonadaceae bacterium GTF-13]
MYFDSFASFIEMGGHGPYVWVCYAITALVVIFNVWSPLRIRKSFIADMKRRMRREAKQS